MTQKAAREKWCPDVRIDNKNRLHNSLTDGFQNSEKMYHCIVGDCMGWREFHLSHLKGDGAGVQSHGYCGYAGEARTRIASSPVDQSGGDVLNSCLPGTSGIARHR